MIKSKYVVFHSYTEQTHTRTSLFLFLVDVVQRVEALDGRRLVAGPRSVLGRNRAINNLGLLTKGRRHGLQRVLDKASLQCKVFVKFGVI